MRRYALVAAIALVLAAVFVTVAVYAIHHTETVAWGCQYWIQVGHQRLCFSR